MSRRARARPYPLTQRLIDRAGGVQQLAEELGTSRRTVHRMLDHGLTDEEADTLACALGDHPTTIWPDWGLHSDYQPDDDDQLLLFDIPERRPDVDARDPEARPRTDAADAAAQHLFDLDN